VTCGTASKMGPVLGKPSSPTAVSLSFPPLLFILLHQAETENQTESNSVTSWTPSLWKASHAMLHWEKLSPFLPTTAGSKPAWVSIGKWTGEHHTQCGTPLPIPQEHNQCRPWADWPSLNKTEKQMANSNLTWTVEGVGGMLNLPQRNRATQSTKLSVPKSQWETLERQRRLGGGVWQATSQSRTGSGLQRWSPEPESSIQNWSAPPCWGRSWPNSCSWRITQLSAGENNPDHPTWSGKPTSPNNFN
jgi:hypothetical protein